MTGKTEPKLPEREAVRRLRRELCALQEELRLSRELLKRTAEIATRGELHRHAAEAAVATTRRLLREVWETATESETPFFQRLAQLQPFGRQVGEELAALEKGERGGVMAQECRWHTRWQPHCVLCEAKQLVEAAEAERDEAREAAGRLMFRYAVGVEGDPWRAAYPWLREAEEAARKKWAEKEANC